MIIHNSLTDHTIAIQQELDTVENDALRQAILDLLNYAEEKDKEKKEAENRDLRPKDDDKNAAYYRDLIDMDALPTETLRNLIEDLLQWVESIENQLQVSN